MALTWIPGYLGTVTLNTDDLSTTGRVVSLELSKGAQAKPVFGSLYQRAVSGSISGTFSAEGHVATTKPVADLFDALESSAPVPYSIQLGDAAGATDGGTIAGNCILTGLTVSGDAEGEWDWTVTAMTDGAVTDTPGTP